MTQFLVLGDWGGGNSLYTKAKILMAFSMGSIYDDYLAQKDMAPESQFFVVSVGDNFYPYGVQGVDDDVWQTQFVNIYEKLQCPWYSVLGNHDWEGNHEAQIAYKADWRWQMDGLYYTKIIGGIQFIFIDTITLCPEYSNNLIERSRNVVNKDLVFSVNDANYTEQLIWLEDTLKSSTSDWIFVVGHYPIYSGGEHGKDTSHMQHLNALFKQYRIDAYFCGHDHNLQHIYDAEVTQYHHFLSGSGCGALAYVKELPGLTRCHERVAGFIHCTEKENGMDVKFIAKLGEELYHVELLKQNRN